MKMSFSKILLALAGVVWFALYTTGCKKVEIKTTTTDDVNIVGYLDKHLDSFSLFRQILDRTETAAFLNAYGAYTCFAVTNTGVRTWLGSIGAASVEAANLNSLKDMVKFHLLEDTITTAAFTDGKLPVVTMYGQYLITGVTTKYGSSNYLVNRQGFILQSNIKVGNGIIHVIDNVLMPAKLSLVKTLESKPDYSIFLQAVRETGFYNLLDSTNNPDPARKWLTLLAESNQALADSGISSYAQLKARYSNTGNPALATDTLHLYVAYHILSGIKFLGDIILAQSHTTFAPQEVVSTKLINQEVLVNDDEFNGIHEPGIVLKRPTSDVQATNGVLHDAKSHFNLKYRKPTAVYWDVSDFPEIRKLPAFFRRANTNFTKLTEAEVPIADITWPLPSNTTTSFLTYFYSSTSTISNYACNRDLNKMPLGGPARPLSVNYRTPVIIKGRYKVWMCYRWQRQSASSNNLNKVLIDGVEMQRTFNFTQARPAGGDGDLEAIFFKRYTTDPSTDFFVGRMVGIVDIATTERHMVKIENITGTQNDNNLDMIHFIPINDNQILPRFAPDGSRVFQ